MMDIESRVFQEARRIMTAEERIIELVNAGFDIVIGRHTAFRGYHVGVFKEDDSHGCDECGYDYRFDLWHFSGHGYTIEEALINGELIAKGKKPVKAYRPEDFEDSDRKLYLEPEDYAI